MVDPHSTNPEVLDKLGAPLVNDESNRYRELQFSVSRNTPTGSGDDQFEWRTGLEYSNQDYADEFDELRLNYT